MKANPQTITSYDKFNKQEFVRLILQSLQDFGYQDSVRCLESESGFQLENTNVSDLRNSILSGSWDKAEATVARMDIDDEQLKTVWNIVLNETIINGRKQKYLECLLKGDRKLALIILRTEIATLPNHSFEVHELSSWLVSSSPESLGDTGNISERRMNLHETLMDLIPKSFVLPQHRLSALLEQSQKYQVSQCLYHNSLNTNFSLYSDHICQREEFPCITTHVFEEHTDEVWFVSFSHNGRYLASASKDATCIIWCINTWKNLYNLSGHEEAVSFLSWSPDDTKLLSCSNDHKVRMWNAETGICIRTFSRHNDAVTSCAWLPEGDRFVSSSLDKTIYLWNVDGSLLYRWLGARVTDLAIDHTGSRMIAVCHEKKIRVYDLNEKSEQYIQEDNSITSLSLSKDSKYALVNISAEEIHLWDLDAKTLVHKYAGQKQGRFVIRSCFGGYDQNFIVSGSEDCNVYIWHREQEKLIEALPGHNGTVNSVTWNPANPFMFASASDDCTIRIWGKPNS